MKRAKTKISDFFQPKKPKRDESEAEGNPAGSPRPAPAAASTSAPASSSSSAAGPPRPPRPAPAAASTSGTSASSSAPVAVDPGSGLIVLQRAVEEPERPLSDAEISLALDPAEKWKAPANYKFPEHNKRRFQASWLAKFEWLCWVPAIDGGICAPCEVFQRTVASTKGGRGGGQLQPHTQLVTRKLTDLKDALSIMKHHANSDTHAACIRQGRIHLAHANTAVDIRSQLDDQRASEKEKNRKRLAGVVKTILFLGQNNVALRGHRDAGPVSDDNSEGEGIFRSALKFRVDAGDTELKSLLTESPLRVAYTSPGIQNEIIDTIKQEIIANLKEKFVTAGHFSVMMDETTDVQGREQATIVIRTVDESGEVSEDFVGFVEAEDLTGRGLANLLLRQLDSIGLNVADCRGQGYDGAAAMQGQFNGLQAVLKEKEPLALYIHCHAHRLNLAVSKACQIPEVRNFFGMLANICEFINASPKRIRHLERIIEEKAGTDHRKRKLKSFCPTRWVEKHTAVAIFNELLPHILSLLEELSTDTDAKTSANARIYVAAVMSASFCVTLAVINNLMGLTANLSQILQERAQHLGDAVGRINDVIRRLKEKRENAEETFRNLFEKAEEIAKLTDVEIVVPRQAGRQHHRANIPAADPEEYYRRTVFLPFIDFLIEQLSSRFQDSPKVLDLQELLPQHCREGSVERVCAVATQYERDLPDTARVVKFEIEEWMNEMGAEGKTLTLKESVALAKKMSLPNVVALLRLFAVIPVTTATAERSFSQLRRLKTYLRSTMTTERLTGLALMAVHREVKLEVEQIISRFRDSKQRRLAL